MTLNVSPIVEPIDSESALDAASNNVAVSKKSPPVTPSIFMGSKPVLKNWKMFGEAPQDLPEDEIELPPELKSELKAEAITPRNFSDRAIRSRPTAPYWLQIGQALAVFVTVAWLTYAAIYILALPNSIKTITSSPLTLGGILASVLAPIAMLWLCLATWQRRSDAHIYAQALREELRGLFYPNADQSNLIADDIRDLMKQATEMSAASRGSIKAIQRARTGLRAEIRDFAGVSQKAEFHIDRLSESLSKRAEELLSLTETIEAQTSNITAKAQQGVTQWENVSAEITELGDELNDMFDAGAEKLQTASSAAIERVKAIETSMADAVVEMSSKVDGTATSIADKMEAASEAAFGRVKAIEASMADAVVEMSSKVDDATTSIADKMEVASEAALGRVKAIEVSMTDAVEGMASKINGVATQIEETRSNLDDQANRLVNVSQLIDNGASRLEDSLSDAEHIYGAVEGMMNIMSESLNKVEGTAEHFFDKTNAIEQKLESRADALKDSADKLLSSTDGLQEVGDLAANKLSEALSMALSGADTITNAVRRSKEMMDLAVIDASTQIEKTSKIADEKLEALMAEAKANRDQLNQIIAEIEEKQALLSATTQKMNDSRVELSGAVDKATSSLGEATSTMVAQSDKPLQLIQSSINQLQEYTQEMESKLAARTVEVQQETGKLKSLVAGINDNVGASVEKLVSAANQVSEKSVSVNDAISLQRVSLDGFIQDLDTKTTYANTVLAERKGNIESSISSAEEKIASLGTSFFDRGDALIEKVNFVSEQITGYEDTLSASIISVNSKYDEVAEKVSGQIETITQLSAVMAPAADRILSRVDAIHSSYDILKDKCFAVVEEASGALTSLGDKLETRIINLGVETAETSRVFSDVTGNMTETLSNIKNVAEEAQDRIGQIQSGMKGRVDDLHLISDRVQMKVEMMQNNLGTYAKDLNDVLHLTMADLELATEKFGDTTSILNQKTEGVTSRMMDVTRQYTEEGHRMSLLGEQTLHKAARIVAIIQQESDKLVNNSKSSLIDLQKAGDSLSIRTKEIEEYLKASTHHTRNYSDGLREQASLIANHSSDIVDSISAATMKLSIKANEMKQNSNIVIDDIENAGVRLEEGTAALGRVARATIDAVDDAVTGFAEHGNVLRTTVNGLTAQMQNVKDVQARTERETFLSSAKFVIESLYSLAVDVSRHMEGELDVRVLRTYQKGDVSAYVRHLVELAPRMPIDKSQRKFIEDGEFRTYVLRFIRQYEELLEQAQANDYGDLLSSVFSTSDIGKLYKVLCEIAGRNSRDH